MRPLKASGVLLTVLISLVSSSLYANWNEDFEVQSRALIKSLPQFQTESYLQEYEGFSEIKESLVRDGSLKRKLIDSPLSDRTIILRPRQGVVIKKRADNIIRELFAYEVSLLLGSSVSSFVPAFPLEIGGKKVIIQKMEPFDFGKGDRELPSSSSIKKVSVEGYWKAHLQAYILGIGDLLGRNIGVNAEGKIRFFDVEASFRYSDEIYRRQNAIGIGFVAESFDWPQYRMPLDKKTAENLRNFIRKLSGFEEKASIYQECRGYPVLTKELLFRLAKVRAFSFEEGQTFRDFFGLAYPTIDAGLDDLNRIVSHIYKRKVDHGASLIFISQHIEKMKLTSEEKKEVEDWIARYVD